MSITTKEQLGACWRDSIAAERAGDIKTAEAGYRAILKAAPAHAPAIRRLAGIGVRLGDRGAAIRLLDKALAAAPDYWPARLDLADLKQGAGAYESAAALYAEGLQAADKPDPARLSNYAAVLLKLGRYGAALEATDTHRKTGAVSANVTAYRAQALWELERDREALSLADPGQFVFRLAPATPDGYEDIAAFNAALVEAFETHPTLTDRWDESQRAARGGRVTGNIFATDVAAPPAITALQGMIEGAVTTLAAGLPQKPDHPFLGRRPKQPIEMVGWANLMPGQGVQAAHVHNLGWLSGVYYPKLPATLGDAQDHAGWLGFGRPGYGIATTRPPHLAYERPAEGVIVCFPSYLWHWTEPFTGKEKRVSVAFDIA